MNDIDALIAAWMSGEATPKEVQRLFDWVRKTPGNAREFARATSLHSDLSVHFSNERNLKELGESPIVVKEPEALVSRSSQRRMWSISATVAACVLLLVSTSLLLVNVEDSPQNISESRPVTEPFATVAQLENATWDRDRSPAPGERLASEELVLLGGRAKILFDDGVEVTLQGPARFRLISNGSSRLTSGMLTAAVPPGAEGFSVDTPSAEIIDLGTAFGVNVSESQSANVSVFDGSVHVFPKSGGIGQMLGAGEEVNVALGKSAEAKVFDSRPFEQLWPVTSGVGRTAGAVQLESPWSGSPQSPRDDSLVVVEPEGYATVLSRPLTVNAVDAGEYSRFSQFEDVELSAGSRIRSFLVRIGAQASAKRGRVVGEITFNRKVVGLLFKPEQLEDSGSRLVAFRRSSTNQPLELTEDQLGDAVTLSADKRTVNLDLVGRHRGAGELRVLVDDSYSEMEDTRLAIANVGAPEAVKSKWNEKSMPSDSHTQSQSSKSERSLDDRFGRKAAAHRFLRMHDRNEDGRVSADELHGHLRRMIHHLDLNNDGYLTLDELPDRRPPPGMWRGPGSRP